MKSFEIVVQTPIPERPIVLALLKQTGDAKLPQAVCVSSPVLTRKVPAFALPPAIPANKLDKKGRQEITEQQVREALALVPNLHRQANRIKKPEVFAEHLKRELARTKRFQVFFVPSDDLRHPESAVISVAGKVSGTLAQWRKISAELQPSRRSLRWQAAAQHRRRTLSLKVMHAEQILAGNGDDDLPDALLGAPAISN